MFLNRLSILKKVLPHVVAIVVFALAAVIYFYPQYDNRDVQQFDTVQANGMKASTLEHIEKYGEHPQWTGNMFGGMPTYAIHMDYEGQFLPKIAGLFFFLGTPAAFYFVLMLGFYFMLLCFRVNPYTAIVGALGYGFSSYFIIIYGAGHIMKLVALCYVAPMIGSLYMAYRDRLWLGGSLFALFAALEIGSVHPQIFYYFIIVMGIMVIAFAVDAINNRQFVSFLKRSAAVACFSLLAVGANAYYLYYTSQYTKESTRGASVLGGENASHGLDKQYITEWSYGKGESFNMLIPNLVGGTSEGGLPEDGKFAKVLKNYGYNQREVNSLVSYYPGYHGPQPMTSGPVYLGAVIILLFLFGLFFVRGVNLWWIVASSILALFLAWGRNFMFLTDLFIDYFPLYNRFRTVSMILVVLQLTVPLLAMLGLDRVVKGEVPKIKVRRALAWSLGIVGGICLFFLLFGGYLFNFVVPQEYELDGDMLSALISDRKSMLRWDAFRSLGFAALAALMVWLLNEERFSKTMLVVSLSVLVLADMIPVDLRYLPHSKFVPKKRANVIEMREADKMIKQDTALGYRVADLTVNTFADASASAFHRSVGGYFAAKPRRYQDLIDHHLSKMNLSVYDMLNTKYFIVPAGGGNIEIQENPEALGNAWFVEDVEIVSGPGQEIDALNLIDPGTTAVVGGEFEPMLPSLHYDNDGTDEIVMTGYRDNRMTYRSSTSSPRLAVFSEMWYPNGWTAYIDGEQADYLRANYVLEAMVVPAGEHEIAFEFCAPHYGVLRTVVTTSSVLIILSLLASLAYPFIYGKKR